MKSNENFFDGKNPDHPQGLPPSLLGGMIGGRSAESKVPDADRRIAHQLAKIIPAKHFDTVLAFLEGLRNDSPQDAKEAAQAIINVFQMIGEELFSKESGGFGEKLSAFEEAIKNRKKI